MSSVRRPEVSASVNAPPPRTIVSIHIPKVGGTSFRQNLFDNNDPERCLLVYDRDTANKVNSGTVFDSGHGPGPQVVHGHLRPHRRLFDLSPRPFFVVWLRHPVDRLLSLHRYWSLLEPSGNPVHDEFLRTRPTPAVFARSRVRHEMLTYFDQISLHEYDFVGLIEHYDDDLADLGRLLGWTEIVPYRANRTPSAEIDIRESDRAEIGRSLTDSIALYQQALSLRERRRHGRSPLVSPSWLRPVDDPGRGHRSALRR